MEATTVSVKANGEWWPVPIVAAHDAVRVMAGTYCSCTWRCTSQPWRTLGTPAGRWGASLGPSPACYHGNLIVLVYITRRMQHSHTNTHTRHVIHYISKYKYACIIIDMVSQTFLLCNLQPFSTYTSKQHTGTCYSLLFTISSLHFNAIQQ